MSLQNTPRLGLPLLQSGQTGAYITLNESLWKLEALVQARALSRSVAAEPAEPQAGDAYILPEAASGAEWGNHQAGDFLIFWGGYWNPVPQANGAIVFVEDEGLHLVREQAGWGPLNVSQNLAHMGINATADDYNRLSVSSPAVLFTHAGSGVQAKLNKNTSGDTASVLWQTGWSGRAEFGTNGSDNLSLKVSGDGERWITAYEVNRFSGRVSFRKPPYKASSVLLRNYLRQKSWKSSAVVPEQGWVSVCWAAELGLFCAVAENGAISRIMTSGDGINWTGHAGGAGNVWRSVCWSPQLRLFVAVANSGSGNRVMTSPDGINWTLRASAADNLWFYVCWSAELGLFCAVAESGTGNRVMTSPDGINWTARASAADNSWRAVCWSAELGLFCAVAQSGTGNRVMTSPDGINWATQASPADNGWCGISWSAELGLFCAVAQTGTGNRVMTSPDGVNWTLRTSAADNNWRSICWAEEAGLFAAVADTGTGNRIMMSADGVNWSLHNGATNNNWFSVCWSAELGLFCATAYSGTGERVMTSVSIHSFPYRS